MLSRESWFCSRHDFIARHGPLFFQCHALFLGVARAFFVPHQAMESQTKRRSNLRVIGPAWANAGFVQVC